MNEMKEMDEMKEMNRKLNSLAAVLMSALILTAAVPDRAVAQTGYQPSPENIEARKKMADMRFGIFIHWGIYSMLGHGEWAMQVENLNYKEYAHLAAGFCPSKFSAAQWADAIKASGAGYVTITSRHHDGFSMFRTEASPYNIVDATPFKRDIIKELSEECAKRGIQLNLYYSILDWGREDYYPRGNTGNGTGRPDGDSTSWGNYHNFMKKQLTELLTGYGPIGAIWLDGLWDKDKQPAQMQPEIWNLYDLYDLVHKSQPSCLVGNNHHLVNYPGEDIQIFERDIPGRNEGGYSANQGISTSLLLETCQTMNGSWGYRITDRDYKSVDELIRYLVTTASKGANLLLNIGPRPDGTFPDEALERLKGIGQWLSRYGETIYGTSAGLMPENEWGVSTFKSDGNGGGKLYLHILGKVDQIDLASILDGKRKIKACWFDTSEPVSVKKGIVTITPSNLREQVDNVIVVSFEKGR